MPSLFEHDLMELKSFCRDHGAPESHAEAVLRHFYKNLLDAPWDHDPLPLKLRADFDCAFAKDTEAAASVAAESVSAYDRSVKFLVRLTDGASIECVLMPESGRITLCVSSQVGCARRCSFCRTGQLGLRRNLTAGEIVAQVRLADQWIKRHPEWLQDVPHPMRRRITNIVFMGMGEPLDNVGAVIKSIKIMTEPHGLLMAIRRISVSTAGHVDNMRRLAAELPKVRMAIALHAVSDEKRSLLMPINRCWPLADLLACLHELLRTQEHGFLIQYLLVGGFNDSVEDADALVRLLAGLTVKVNLIPYNSVETPDEPHLKGPSPQSVEAFRDRLHQSGIRVMIRFSKGQDIEAACGQLAAQDWTQS